MVKMKWFDWILSVIILLVIVTPGIAIWTDFNLFEWIFRIDWLIKTMYTIVAVVGVIGLFRLIILTFKKL